MSDTTYPVPESSAPGYFAVPHGQGPWPGVVVVQDVLGMTADLRRITDRLAASGYLALAPALYGRPPKIRCMISTIRAHFAGHGAAYDGLVAAREHLIADERCTGKVGLVGFCMGAGFCLVLSSGGLFDATAANYGLLPQNIESLSRSCPVVASFGAKDRIAAAGTAAKLDAVLARGEVPRDVKEYPHVGHSFMNNWDFPVPVRIIERILGMAYSEPEAEDAWQRILTFFEEHIS
ncbi:MAG: dienelactone hydrolase family protein [Mycobacterium sp.]